MFKTNTDFKIGKLNALEDQVFEISEENQLLNFHIEGRDNNNVYSLNFTSIISLEEMLKFPLNKKIDFIPYVDSGDIVFGKNGVYDLNLEIKINIIRYVPHSFLLIVDFKERDNLVGYLELSFSIESGI